MNIEGCNVGTKKTMEAVLRRSPQVERFPGEAHHTIPHHISSHKGGTRFRRVEVLPRGFLCERVSVLTFWEWPAVWARLFTCINPVFGTIPNRVQLNEKMRPKTGRNFGSDFWEAIVTDSVEIVAPTLRYRTTSNRPLASLVVWHEPMSRISYVFETRT